MSTMIIFTMYFVLQGKDLTIKVILMIVLEKYFNVHQPPPPKKKKKKKIYIYIYSYILEQTNG